MSNWHTSARSRRCMNLESGKRGYRNNNGGHAERWYGMHTVQSMRVNVITQGKCWDRKEKWAENWAQGPSSTQITREGEEQRCHMLFTDIQQILINSPPLPGLVLGDWDNNYKKKRQPSPLNILCSWESYLTWLHPRFLIFKTGLIIEMSTKWNNRNFNHFLNIHLFLQVVSFHNPNPSYNSARPVLLFYGKRIQSSGKLIHFSETQLKFIGRILTLVVLNSCLSVHPLFQAILICKTLSKLPKANSKCLRTRFLHPFILPSS